jgi:NADH:ubiquinone oxidoreductase subunit F (NADH-binding)
VTAQLRLVISDVCDDPALAWRDGALLDAAVTYPVDSCTPVTSLVPDDISAHRLRFGDRPRATGDAGLRLIDTLEQTRLDGRGGGRFPAATKWRAHLAAGGGGVVVANGAESEPASAKDTALLQFRPHLVLDGLACAAEAVGAERAVVWLHEGAHAVHAAVVRAIDERRASGVIEPPVTIAIGPNRYTSGESSAIVRALSGGPTLPDFRRVPAAVSGVNGRPTLVHNVETLARTALAARRRWADRSPTSLLTVATAVGRTVVEVAGTTRLAQVIDSVLGPGASRDQQAVLLGGYGGTWIGRHMFEALRIAESSARLHGVSLGAGVVMPLHQDSCGLAETAAIAGYLADGSARQCGPCVFGLRALADQLDALVDLRARRRDLARLQGMLDEIDGRGACHNPDGAVRMIGSAVRTFAADVRSHLRASGCRHSGGEVFFPARMAD